MPEYVYALHDFQPEHEDEISFRAGDRIEIIEKDDMYGDGWWQVRFLPHFIRPPFGSLAFTSLSLPPLFIFTNSVLRNSHAPETETLFYSQGP